MSSDEDIFMQTAKGRYPLAQGTGGAFDWSPKDTTMPNPQNPDEPYVSPGAYVPRPDRTYSALLWSSILGGVFGLDHFYLRSPKTGVLKFLTLGGLMLWWIWDILQLVFEKKRVLAYGMTTPFDITQGVGQGMITDAATQYSQRSSYLGFLVGILFGFLGLDMLSLGHVGQFVRKLLLSLISLHMIYSNIIVGEGKLMNIIFGIFGVVLGGGVFISYFANLNRVFNNSDKLFAPDATGGLPLPKTAQDMLNWFRPQIPDDATNVRKHWMFYPISSDELRNDFWIAHPNDVSPVAGQQNEDDSWLLGAIGAVGYNLSYILRKIVEGVLNLIPAYRMANKMKDEAVSKYKKVESKVEGKIAQAEKIAGNFQKRAEGVMDKAESVVNKVDEGVNSIQHQVQGGISSLQEQAQGGLSSLQEQAQGGLSSLQEQAQGGLSSLQGQAHVGLSSLQQKAQGGLSSLQQKAQGGLSSLQQKAQGGLSSLQQKAQGGLSSLQQKAQGGLSSLKQKYNPIKQTGGGDELSTESIVLGGTILALIAGGALKGVVDYVMPE